MVENKITVQTTVSADIKKVWEYWTLPQHIVHWNFASDDWHCPHAENDLRTGGKFTSTMAAKSGDMSFDFEGTYEEVIDHQNIAYSLADGRQVTVEFEGLDTQTKVTERFDPDTSHSADMQRAGWQAILDNFRKYVETA
ncbi:SRPBCC family protein [Rufibacter sp. XAAS-G3-1]|uniref:SRPBCC family protein n=1 Tax=Rufibacter sp. XAAS-G3-1 TaxID=2729134 RepID=UPI0015E7ABC6|nr:SRPBCC family protein [Rufibacter sp. XAAS-G3-1]